MKHRPWSKLKKELIKLWVEELDLDIHQVIYRMQSQMGSTNLPRYFMTLKKEVIYDFPKDFKHEVLNQGYFKTRQLKDAYPYEETISHLSQVIKLYIDTPIELLLSKEFPQDFGLTLIFKSADRRIGKNKLQEWAKTLSPDSIAHKVLNQRFKD